MRWDRGSSTSGFGIVSQRCERSTRFSTARTDDRYSSNFLRSCRPSFLLTDCDCSRTRSSRLAVFCSLARSFFFFVPSSLPKSRLKICFVTERLRAAKCKRKSNAGGLVIEYASIAVVGTSVLETPQSAASTDSWLVSFLQSFSLTGIRFKTKRMNVSRERACCHD